MTAGPAFARFDDLLSDAFDRHWTGRERLTVSQWAERYRVVADSSPWPGPWRNDRVPFLVPIMDDFSDPAVAEVVLKCASQVGKTEVLLNALLWHLDTHAANVLYISANIDLARDVNTERILPAMRASLAADRLLSPRPHDAKVESVTTPNGVLYMFGANSPAGLASKTARLALRDEVGKWPDKVKAKGNEEGSALELAEARVSAYGAEGTLGTVSTPTVAGANIDALYDSTDRAHLRCPCPHCGWWQPIVFRRVIYPVFTDHGEEVPLKHLSGEQLAGHAERALHESVYVCDRCAGAITDAQRPGMLRAAVWVRAGQEQDPETGAITGVPVVRSRRGYAFSRLHMPGKVWGEAAAAWVRQRGVASQGFVNNYLGEAWETGGAGGGRHQLHRAYAASLERAGDAKPAGSSVAAPGTPGTPGTPVPPGTPTPDPTADPRYVPRYARGAVPPGALLLVGGVDVQLDRVKAAVWGLGAFDRAYLIDLVEVPWPRVPDDDAPAPGVPYPLERARAVADFLARPWPCSEGGAPRSVDLWGIDSKYRSGEVYSLVRASPPWVLPVNGGWRPDDPGLVLAWDPDKVLRDKGARASDAARILDRPRQEINHAQAKPATFDRLRTHPPAWSAAVYPEGIKAHELDELEAEQEVTRERAGATVHVWEMRKGALARDYWHATLYALALGRHLLEGECTPEAVARLRGEGGPGGRAGEGAGGVRPLGL